MRSISIKKLSKSIQKISVPLADVFRLFAPRIVSRSRFYRTRDDLDDSRDRVFAFYHQRAFSALLRTRAASCLCLSRLRAAIADLPRISFRLLRRVLTAVCAHPYTSFFSTVNFRCHAQSAPLHRRLHIPQSGKDDDFDIYAPSMASRTRPSPRNCNEQSVSTTKQV